MPETVYIFNFVHFFPMSSHSWKQGSEWNNLHSCSCTKPISLILKT